MCFFTKTNSKITEFGRVEPWVEMTDLKAQRYKKTIAAWKVWEAGVKMREPAAEREAAAEAAAAARQEAAMAAWEAGRKMRETVIAAEAAAAKADVEAWVKAQFHTVDAQGNETPIMCEHGQPLYSCMPCSH